MNDQYAGSSAHQQKMQEGWISLGLLAVAGALGATIWRKHPILGTISGMLAITAVRRPLSWSSST